MSKTYLISQEELQGETALSKNTDGEKLKVSIWNFQVTRVKPLLGNQLYDQVYAQKAADTLTSLNETLMTYILPFLAWGAYSDHIILSAQDSTKSGWRVLNDEYSEPVTDKRLQELTRIAEQKVEYYEAELINYLEENEDDYPLYEGCNDSPSQNTLKITSIGIKNGPDKKINHVYSTTRRD